MTAKPPNFMALVHGLELVWKQLVEQVPDLKALDQEELMGAEITVYQLAGAYAAQRHGLPEMAFIQGVVDCMNDLRRDAGKPPIQMFGDAIGLRPAGKA